VIFRFEIAITVTVTLSVVSLSKSGAGHNRDIERKNAETYAVAAFTSPAWKTGQKAKAGRIGR